MNPYYDGGSDEELEEERSLRSQTLSESSDGKSRGPAASRRDKLRSVLLPAIQSRVNALGGMEDVQIEEDADEDGDDEEELDEDGNERAKSVAYACRPKGYRQRVVCESPVT